MNKNSYKSNSIVVEAVQYRGNNIGDVEEFLRKSEYWLHGEIEYDEEVTYYLMPSHTEISPDSYVTKLPSNTCYVFSHIDFENLFTFIES